jgi:TFIIF-interacting CTD phosphatase-like protein
MSSVKKSKNNRNNTNTNNTNNTRKRNTFVNSNNKLNIIFDIDETLIQSHHNESGILYKGDMMMGKSKKGDFLIYLRPYLRQLLEFCYKYFNISYWTSGETDYAQSILKNILTKSQYEKTKMILARVDQNEFKDCKTDKNYVINLHNDYIGKPLDYLWDHPDFRYTFNRNNTVIIDDNPLNIALNQHNSIFIYPWCRFDKKDRKLKTLIKLLKQHKKAKTIKDIKPYTLHIPRKLGITEVNAYQCREIDDKEQINRILGKIN